MVAERIITGVVQNGVIVPKNGLALPEGTLVEIVLPQVPAGTLEVTSELQAEVALWQRASDEDFAASEREQKRRAAIVSLRGKVRGDGRTVDDFLRERHEESDREEARFQDYEEQRKLRQKVQSESREGDVTASEAA